VNLSSYRAGLACLLLLASLILLAGIGLRDPWPADEPRFALIAKDMVESGQWLFPQVGGVLYPDKPPLFFWMVACFYTLTGSISVAILLPGSIAGVGVLLLVTDLTRRLTDEVTALWTGALLLVLLQFPLQMKTGQIDGLLCLFTTVSLYGLCRHLLLGPDWRWYGMAGFSAGLGIITKGVGFLPFLILLPYAYARHHHWPLARLNWSDRRWLLAPLALLLAVSIWLVPMLFAVAAGDDPLLVQYRDDILLHQTITRYADSWDHVRPAWYLFTRAVPRLWLPVTPLLPWLIPAWRSDLRNRNSAVLLLGSWVLLVLLFFSLSDGKRSLYIFPAAPAVAMLCGLHIESLLARAGPRRTVFGLALLLAVTLAAAGTWLMRHPDELASLHPDLAIISAAAHRCMIIGLTALAATLVCRLRRAHFAYAATIGIVFVGAATTVYPLIDQSRSGAAIIDRVEAELPDGATLGLAGWPEQLLLQWDAPAVHFGFRRPSAPEIDDAVTWLHRSLGNVLLLPGHLLNDCFDRSGLTPLGTAHRRDWYLADRRALTDDCLGVERPIERIVFYRPTPAQVRSVAHEPAYVYRQALLPQGSR